MVERDFPKLKSKKFCKPEHSSKLKFFCAADETLLCEECAPEHVEHFYELKDIKSIIESKLLRFRELKSRLSILSKMQVNSDEIRSFIGHQIENAFDQLISRVVEMKNEWIEEQNKRIIEAFGVDLSLETAVQLTSLIAEVDEIFKKMQKYVVSETISNPQELLNLKSPEEFGGLIDQILIDTNSKRVFKDISINVAFEPEVIRNMFRISGVENIDEINMPPKYYSGSILTLRDLHFVVQQLPRPVKSLKLLFSGAKDGMMDTTFHQKCDGHSDTLIVVKSGNLTVFGGYARPAWDSNNHWIVDPSMESFLYTCRTKTKHILTDATQAIYGGSPYGPIFGSGNGLRIWKGKEAHTALGNTYALEPGKKNEDFMSGTSYGASFQLLDYEVHQVMYYKSNIQNIKVKKYHIKIMKLYKLIYSGIIAVIHCYGVNSILFVQNPSRVSTTERLFFWPHIIFFLAAIYWTVYTFFNSRERKKYPKLAYITDIIYQFTLVMGLAFSLAYWIIYLFVDYYLFHVMDVEDGAPAFYFMLFHGGSSFLLLADILVHKHINRLTPLQDIYGIGVLLLFLILSHFIYQKIYYRAFYSFLEGNHYNLAITFGIIFAALYLFNLFIRIILYESQEGNVKHGRAIGTVRAKYTQFKENRAARRQKAQ